MALERRKHPRYRPVAEVGAQLRDDSGGYQVTAQLFDLSEGGCSLLVATPPRGGTPLIVEFAFEPDQLSMHCRMTARCNLGDAWQISVAFTDVAIEDAMLLRATLASESFALPPTQATATNRKHWRVDQWAAFLTAQDLPVMARSKEALAALEANHEQTVSVRELADLANGDPFLCLCLLREAESRRSSRLGHETTTPLAGAMQLGFRGFRELLMTSPETDESLPGLAACEARATVAGKLAANWSTARADISPDELVMAALLSEMGELMLWHFAPELPQAVQDALLKGEAQRSVEAQELRCGFRFKDLTLKCAEIWHLPQIIVQLIRGTDSARANLARICIDTARHLVANPNNPALPDDLADAKMIISGASLSWLASWLTEVPEESRPELVEKAEAALEKKHRAAEEARANARHR